jgi:hypothetical protein
LIEQCCENDAMNKYTNLKKRYCSDPIEVDDPKCPEII